MDQNRANVKLTDDFNPRKNTCIIFNVHSKNKQIFVQKSAQSYQKAISWHLLSFMDTIKCFIHRYILYDNLTAKIK